MFVTLLALGLAGYYCYHIRSGDPRLRKTHIVLMNIWIAAAFILMEIADIS